MSLIIAEITIAQNSPLTIGAMKEQLRVHGLRRVVYNSRDYAEGIHAFMEKRPPSYIGE